MLTFLSIADKRRPKWILWENVPGVLSSNGGKDFGTFLGALGELGYGFAYRVLDAQHFGVAQRRRRVFVVGYLGDWRPAGAVLFESESLQRDSKQSRAKRQETPTDAQGSVRATSDVSFAGGNVSPCVTSKWKTGYGGPSGSNETGNMVYEQVAQPSHAFKVRGGCEGGGKGYLGQDEKAFTISAMQDQQVAQPKAAAFIVAKGSTSRSIGYREENAPTLVADQGNNSAVLCPIPVAQPFRKVRRAKSETDFETWEKDEKANTLNCFDQGDVRSTNVVAQPIVVSFSPSHYLTGFGPAPTEEIAGTIKARANEQSPHVAQPIALASKQYSQNIGNNIANPLLADDYKEPQVVAQPIAAHKVSPTLTAKMQGMSGWAPYNETEHLVPVAQPIAVDAPTIIDRAAFNQGQNAQYEPMIEQGQTMPSLVAKGPHAVAGFLPTQGSKAQGIGYAEEQAPTLRAGCDNYGVMHTMAIRRLTPKVFDWQSGGDARGLDLKDTAQLQRCQTPALLHTMAIRRLTPKECERLQGFPDDWTKIPYRNKPADQCPDGPRYKACGNSMAVPVMRWIGERIQMIENYLNPNL